jgi:hypothetical protein
VPDPGSSTPRVAQEILYELLAEDIVQIILQRTNEAARTQKWLVANINPKRETRIGEWLRWLRALGILDGSPKTSYRLAVADVLDILDLVVGSPPGQELWIILKNPVGRAVVAALLHGERERTELTGHVGERTQVVRMLDMLAIGGVARHNELDGHDYYHLVEPARYARILGGMEIVVATIAEARASAAGDTLRRIAYPAAPLDDFEPTALGSRVPPDEVPRYIDGSADATPTQRAAASVWEDLASPGLLLPSLVPRYKRSLSGLPHRPFPGSDARAEGVSYFEVPGVAEAILAGLKPVSSTEDLVTTFATIVRRHHGTLQPSTAGQERGRRRITILVQRATCSPQDLEPPALAWSTENEDPSPYAATFDEDRNELRINFTWRDLSETVNQWVDEPLSLFGWVERTIRFQHALKLVGVVFQHEHDVASRLPSQDLLQLTPDALTAAARFSATDRVELKRRINQHFKAHQVLRSS